MTSERLATAAYGASAAACPSALDVLTVRLGLQGCASHEAPQAS
jgi:hypothetical protein